MSSVVIRSRSSFPVDTMFSGISSNILKEADFDSISFTTVDCSHRVEDELREMLISMPLDSGRHILLRHAPFVYPAFPWERSLFVRLFDNAGVRNAVVDKYADILRGDVVGYTVRRGDFRVLPEHRILSEADIVADISDIVRRYSGYVRVILTSDEPDFLSGLVRRNDFLAQHCTVVRDTPVAQLYLLSLCDYVVSHGQYQCTRCRVDCPSVLYESTFGQVAQILGRSYGYAGVSPVPAV